MKNLALIITTLIFFPSCFPLMQVLEADSNNLILDQETYYYENEDIRIDYNLWKEGGKLEFTIYNRTNKPIYIDWQNSNFIRLGKAFDYWEDATTGVIVSEGNISTVGGTVTEGNKSGTLGFSSFKSISKIYQNKERPSKQLPPRSYTNVYRFNLIYPKGNFPKVKNKMEVLEKSFSKLDTPFHFRNYLSYSFDKNLNDPRFVDNEFWVKKVSTMRYFFYEGKFSKKMNPSNNKFFEQETQTNNALIPLFGGVLFVVVILAIATNN